MTKICTKCKVEKPKQDFHKNCQSKDGLASNCKECRNSVNRKYRKNNPQYLEYHKKNKDKKREYDKEYRSDNRDSILLKKKKYYNENKERHLERSRNWRLNNRGKANSIRRKYDAKKLQATPSWSEFDKINIVYEKAIWLSNLTGKSYHVDHIIPLQGKDACGLHVWENLQILEGSLNCSKGNKHE